MSELFAESERKDFRGIEQWDVSKVKDMEDMFSGSPTKRPKWYRK